ncbi:hypothetical protein [Streptomyces sp. NPDC001502]|uniref:hypothetical protein n=1 Tax=Streptomyces sp. NPDC001502 TaxID=3364578 RepID=UPI00369B04D0
MPYDSQKLADWPDKVEAAIEGIVELVVAGTLEMGPDNPATEPWLSDSVGLERTYIRRALAVLSRDNIVGQIPGEGAWVWPVHVADLQRMTKLRHRIEIPAACSLVSRDPMPDLSVLDAWSEYLIQVTKSGASFSVNSLIYADTGFHSALTAAGGYALGSKAIETWGRRARMYFSRPEHHEILAGGYSGIVAATEKIFECISERDAGVSEFSEWYFEEWRRLLAITPANGTLSIEVDDGSPIFEPAR